MNKLLLTSVLAVLLAGCATTPGPTVNLVNVQFTQATVLETTAQFTLRYSNDGPEPVALDGSSHKIYLNGLYIGQGLANQPVEVPRLATATQSVTVHLNNIMMATRIKTIIESKVFDYKINSVFYTSAGTRRSASEGRLDVKDFTPTPRQP